MRKHLLFKKMNIAMIAIAFTLGVTLSVSAEDLSNKVNTHMKDVQWRIDFEKEVRSAEAIGAPAPKNGKTPPRSISTFGVMNHEENQHFDSRPSFAPKEKPSIGNNLNSWAEHSVEHQKQLQEMNLTRREEWFRDFKENAAIQGYEVHVDPKTQVYKLVRVRLPPGSAKRTEARSTDRKPGSRPTGF